MYHSDDISVWNLTPGGTVVGGAQILFNIVGRVHRPGRVAALYYSLNKGPVLPVYIKRKHSRWGRLSRVGDFNIDTITQDQLRHHNSLVLQVVDRTRRVRRHTLHFVHRPFMEPEPRFHLDLKNAGSAEQVGQVIDGHWRVDEDDDGVRCLSIRKEDAGYDRLIAFGRHDWTSGYEVTARLRVTSWTNLRYQNIGLIFKWNPHAQGDGRHLPRKWSTGLAYYAAMCPGLRLRYGVNVHNDDAGRKLGCHVLTERPYSRWRRLLGFIKNEALRLGREPITQLDAGVSYRYRLHLHPDRYALTVWPADEAEPEPQLVVIDPPDLLPTGSVGIIAAHCAVNVYEFEVTPIEVREPRIERRKTSYVEAAHELVGA